MKPHRRIALFVVILGIVVTLALPIPTVRAMEAMVRVTQGGAASGTCGADWDHPCALQYALTTIAGEGDEIWVAAGTYTPGPLRTDTFQLRSGVALYGGFAGGEDERTQRNIAVHETILSGDIGVPGDASDNSYHVVTGSGVDATAVLDGFTVTSGNANLTGHESGGGIYNNGSSPTVTNVTFIGNNAWNGGGMYNNGSSPAVTGCTFSGNTATYSGGGMFNYEGSSPTLTNVTFNGNTATSSGGGMYNASSTHPAIRNAIFWGNTAPSGPQLANDLSSAPTISVSVVQGGCPVRSVCDNIVEDDPLLGTLGDWVGATETIPLLPGSSAIDAGDAAACPTIDQRGIARPQGMGCDIGAFESRGFTLTIIGGDGQSTTINTPFAAPLGVSVDSAHSEPVDGGLVTFLAPGTGASATPATGTVTIAGSSAALSLTANGDPGTYEVRAFAAGAGAPVTFTLTNTLTGTTTTLTASPNPSALDEVVTFTATVSSSAGAPAGSVTFRADGVVIPGCGSQALAGGQATCATATLTVGTHTITAEYLGGISFHASSSAGLLQTVKPYTCYLPSVQSGAP